MIKNTIKRSLNMRLGSYTTFNRNVLNLKRSWDEVSELLKAEHKQNKTQR